MLEAINEKIKGGMLGRLITVAVIIFLMLILLLARIFTWQLVEGAVKDADKGSGSATETVEEEYKVYTGYITPPRGNIYDRNGNVLAYNELVYNLEFFNSADLATNAERNAAIYKLIGILNDYGYTREFEFPMEMDENGNLVFTSTDNAHLRFLKNCFGLASARNLTEEQIATTPDQLFDYLKNGDSITSMFGISDEYTKEEALEIMAYRYQLYINNPSYAPIRVVTGVPEEFRIVILENQNVIPCVELTKSYKRIYNDSIYFAHIIGYIGKITESELSDKTAAGLTNYTADSFVGKLGVENSYDNYLQGEPGEVEIKVNKLGQIVSRTVVKEPVDGGNLYLTLDHDAQIAGYYTVEKNVASILLKHLVNSYSYGTKGTKADDITVPIYEAYAALLTNHVIDTASFKTGKELSEAENRVYSAYASYYATITDSINSLLVPGEDTKYSLLSQSRKDFLDYIYKALRNNWGILNQNVETDSDYFKAYLNGNSSFSEFIYACVENGNFDLNSLGLESGYYTADDIYAAVVTYIKDRIADDAGYDELIYRTLVFDNTISGRDLGLILYDQGVLAMDEDSYNGLKNYSLSAYDFMCRKINNLEITPAMLALQPCSGSLVATDPNTGDVICMVSYPSYDNQKFTNTIDLDYYNKVNSDKSYPVLCRATQSQTTTGSTFKPLTAVLALTEGTITTGTYITDAVKFDRIEPSPSCWSKRGHGTINVSGGIRHSCNYFFFETAYRFSKNASGNYSDIKGISLIRKYAAKFGFDAYSGVEIPEVMPEISNRDAIRTAIGYYHNFAPIHIARYATTIANSGTCYNLTLIDKVCDNEGNIIFEKEPDVYNELTEVSQSTWDAVHLGMYQVVNLAEMKSYFNGTGFDVAGKTGTAQISLNDPNNALFISYGPYSSPEICVTVVIPNGYTSSNAAKTAGDFYNYYFGGVNADNLLAGKVFAGEADDYVVGD
ncbi:MAG: hypothetical protein K5848_02470 [Lachnospiraceae bacterium]|nr:hypothetical protein [Lachnospiraceae bacterium]